MSDGSILGAWTDVFGVVGWMPFGDRWTDGATVPPVAGSYFVDPDEQKQWVGIQDFDGSAWVGFPPTVWQQMPESPVDPDTFRAAERMDVPSEGGDAPATK
jgi:hypothetical protein